MMNYKKTKGFTLIELLVVIAIISLLSSVVLAALRDARQKAQLSSIVSQVKQIQNALELYKDSTGNYPSTTGYTVFIDINTQLIQPYLSPYINSLNLPNGLTLIYIRKEGSSLWGSISSNCPYGFDYNSVQYIIYVNFLSKNYCYGL